MNWAAYLERKFTISENITAEMKRKQKRLRKVGTHGSKLPFIICLALHKYAVRKFGSSLKLIFLNRDVSLFTE
jgi:hypothetical protein